MKTVTTTMLKKLGACAGQVNLFDSLTGGTLSVTADWCAEHAHQFDWNWAALYLLDKAARADYERVTASAQADYARVTAPAWADYARVTAQAWADYERVTAQAWADYERVTASARTDYERVTASAWADYERVTASAFAAAFLAQK